MKEVYCSTCNKMLQMEDGETLCNHCCREFLEDIELGNYSKIVQFIDTISPMQLGEIVSYAQRNLYIR